MSRFRLSICWQVALVLTIAGCHREEPEDIPSADTRKITIADRFYDVVALDAKRIFVCGYAGKLLTTEDGGFNWQLVASGTDKALYAIRFPDPTHGWIVGQDGLILHTDDSGKTWTRQTSGATVYLFSVNFVNAQEGWAVGDKATYVHTTDGRAGRSASSPVSRGCRRTSSCWRRNRSSTT
jgi:Photosynthesis system II assembly factor YCF48